MVAEVAVVVVVLVVAVDGFVVVEVAAADPAEMIGGVKLESRDLTRKIINWPVLVATNK